MGLVYADFTLTNMFTQTSVRIRALIDTGSTGVFVTSEIAQELGFDSDEMSRANIIVADGSTISVAKLRPVDIQFEDRSYCTDVFVLGDECLIGVLLLEALDLVVDPTRLRLVPNPAHPDGIYRRA